jgi:hypothetical protein
VLLVIQVLNVFKPQGVTPYGWRKQQAARREQLEQDYDVATVDAATK